MDSDELSGPLRGANLRRIGATEGLRNVRVAVITGPGDLEQWEVCADLDGHPLPIQVAGRGTDAESAAASLLASVAAHFTDAYRMGEPGDEGSLDGLSAP
jgi:hypothetical protein